MFFPSDVFLRWAHMRSLPFLWAKILSNASEVTNNLTIRFLSPEPVLKISDIPEFGRLRQEDCSQYQVSLCYIWKCVCVCDMCDMCDMCNIKAAILTL